jgi:signal transduction histidine kinase
MAPVLLLGERPELAGLPLSALRIAAVPLLGFAVFVSRRMPVAAAAVPSALGLAATPELYTENFVIAQVLLACLLGRRSAGQRAALPLFAAVCATGLLLLLVTPGATLRDGFSLVATVLVTLVLPWLAGRYARQHAELVRTGWELAERLEREQELVGDRVRLRERSRIAGDMHDSLGHELSLIALRAAALQVAPDVGAQGRQAAGELRQAAAAATERLREVIGVLRDDSERAPVLPAGDTVQSLVERAATSGMAVALVDHLGAVGSDRTQTLPPMADRAVYRVVQEALTNATKHAPEAPVAVTLRREGAQAVVTVVNEAPPAAPHPGASSGPGSEGYGLVSLDERVRQAGGTLRVQPVDGGFAVTARLPLTAGAAATPPGVGGASRRELALARRKVRRSMINAIWVPAAAATVLLLLMFGYNAYMADRTILDEEVYQQLRIDERQSSVENRLPAEEVGGDHRPQHAPADPPGTNERRFYRTGVPIPREPTTTRSAMRESLGQRGDGMAGEAELSGG